MRIALRHLIRMSYMRGYHTKDRRSNIAISHFGGVKYAAQKRNIFFF